ncbi:MAG: TIGR00730 family Rossman fold protein [Candidatus Marinimicrobia bacterium]|nr:TIGR00730 family Rossman fold protein [Candidatus Neomarinimicrobiota bacterium]
MSDKAKSKEFFLDEDFLTDTEARSLRIQSEYLGPKLRLAKNKISDTIVFFGSARILSPEESQANIDSAPADISHDEKETLELDLENSRYYDAARQLADRLTRWSKKLKNSEHRYIITSGGGPGIMQAANRGASEAKGLSIGMNITLPFEPSSNPYITNDLDIQFHYFFMRKFWMAYLAKALVAFPGGFGTLDELMEILTLIQTKKISKRIPIILFGEDFWNNVVNWDYLVKARTISAEDLKLFKITDSIDIAFDFITTEIVKRDFKGPNF